MNLILVHVQGAILGCVDIRGTSYHQENRENHFNLFYEIPMRSPRVRRRFLGVDSKQV